MFLLFAVITPVQAADYVVGVQLDQYADYDAVSDGDWTRLFMEVYGIVGPEVTLNITSYNGTTVSGSSLVTGDISNHSASGLIIMYLMAAGLESGDKIYPDEDWVINETISESWAGVTREINHFNVAGDMLQGWWDQETGLMVKVNFWFFGWINLTMTETNAWAPPELLSTTNLLLGAVGLELIIIVVLLVRGRGKKSKKKR